MIDHTSSSPISLKEWIERGIAFQRSGQHGASVECFRKAYAEEPNPRLGVLYGTALLLSEKPDQAIDILAASAKSLPNNAPVHLNLGLALHQVKRFDEAFARFEYTLQIDPTVTIALRNMANVRMGQDRFAEAIELYNKYHSCTPGDLQIWPNVIWCHIRNGSRSGAFKAAATAFMLGRDDLDFWENVAEIHKEFDDYDAIRSIYMFILRRWPDAHDAALNLATIALAHGDFQTGWVLYDRRFLAKRSR